MINTNTCAAVDSQNSHIPDVERTGCTLLNYGSMVRQLRMLSFWPQINQWPYVLRAASITESVAEVAEKLSNMQVLTWRNSRHDSHGADVIYVSGNERHLGCDSGKLLAHKICAVLVRMGDCISNDTRDTLRRNAGMCQDLGNRKKEI
jgi:hypothetical protein